MITDRDAHKAVPRIKLLVYSFNKLEETITNAIANKSSGNTVLVNKALNIWTRAQAIGRVLEITDMATNSHYRSKYNDAMIIETAELIHISATLQLDTDEIIFQLECLLKDVQDYRDVANV